MVPAMVGSIRASNCGGAADAPAAVRGRSGEFTVARGYVGSACPTGPGRTIARLSRRAAELGGGTVARIEPRDRPRAAGCWLARFGQLPGGRFSNLEIDVEDAAELALEYRDPARLVTLGLNFLDRSPTRRLSLIGSEATITWDGISRRVSLEKGGHPPQVWDFADASATLPILQSWTLPRLRRGHGGADDNYWRRMNTLKVIEAGTRFDFVRGPSCNLERRTELRCQAFIFARGGSKACRARTSPAGRQAADRPRNRDRARPPRSETSSFPPMTRRSPTPRASGGHGFPSCGPTNSPATPHPNGTRGVGALEWTEADEGPLDAMVSLPTTAPFRSRTDVEACIAKLAQTPAADVVLTVAESERTPISTWSP